MRRLIVFPLILLLVLPMLAQGGGVLGSGGTSGGEGGTSTSSSGGGGGSKHLQLDTFIKDLEKWQKEKPDRFDYLKKLLYKEPFTTETYRLPSVFLYYEGNDTVTRNQPLNLSFVVRNDNPIEIRRVLYLTLEMKTPGSDEFEIVTAPQIIQVNEYHETSNTTMRGWPEFRDLQEIRQAGEVELRYRASDGQFTWYPVDSSSGEQLHIVSSNGKITNRESSKLDPPYYRTLALDLVNSPPSLDQANSSVFGGRQPRYNDVITYVGRVSDHESDNLNVTLHVLDDEGSIRGNASQFVKAGEEFEFVANSYGFFSKDDAGKNFTYYYTLDDGINVTVVQPPLDGPRIKKSTTISVDNPTVHAEENYYWWDSYNFTVGMKNQEPGQATVHVSLETWTPSHPWKQAASQSVVLDNDPKTVWFNVKPFRVEDSNQTFRYRFVYSELDQKGRDNREGVGLRKINAKLVRYDLASIPAASTLVALLGLALFGAMFIERRFYR